MLNKLLQKGKRLMRAGTRLFSSGDGTSCCCDGEQAYQYRECCDGQPIIWVALSAFGERGAPCPVIHVGNDDDGNPICFNLTGSEAKTSELDEAGIEYISQFNTAVGDGCASGGNCIEGVTTGTCRECPVACCIRGFPPACKQGPLPCCVLGSAIHVKWKTRRVETLTGFIHGISGLTPDGIAITAGYSAEPIREFIWETTVEMVMVRYGNDGKKCADVEPYCRRTDRYFERQFVTDGYTYTNNEDGYVRAITQVIPVNPRYAVVIDTVNEDQNCNAPIYPDVVYDYNDPNPAIGELVACGASWVSRVCASGVPCPAPGNPWYLQTTMDIDGRFTCTGGSQTYRKETVTKVTPFGVAGAVDNPHPSGENAQTNIVTVQVEYQITQLSDRKCDARSCDDIGVGAGGDPMPLTSSPFLSRSEVTQGCSGCRQSVGL